MKIEENKFITGEHFVKVSFELPYLYWCKLLEKKYWKKVQQFLEEMESKSNQK